MSELPQDLLEIPNENEQATVNKPKPRVNLHAKTPGTKTKSKPRKSSVAIKTVVGFTLLTSVSAAIGCVFLYDMVRNQESSMVASINERMSALEEKVSAYTDYDDRLMNLDAVVKEMLFDVKQMNANMIEYRIRQNKNSEDIEAITDTVAVINEWVVDHDKRTTKVRAAASKSTPSTRAKRIRAHLNLLSMRSIGGMSIVRVGNPSGESSPLLHEGDAWQGWRFTGIATNGNALFERQGQSFNLKL